MTIPVDLSDAGGHLSAQLDGVEVFRYVYEDLTDQLESPRPHLNPLRSLDGDVVSIYRPHDHLWHRGISVALPNVGEHNFWGGVTYTREQGYVQLPNNGRTVTDRSRRSRGWRLLHKRWTGSPSPATRSSPRRVG